MEDVYVVPIKKKENPLDSDIILSYLKTHTGFVTPYELALLFVSEPDEQNVTDIENILKNIIYHNSRIQRSIGYKYLNHTESVSSVSVSGSSKKDEREMIDRTEEFLMNKIVDILEVKYKATIEELAQIIYPDSVTENNMNLIGDILVKMSDTKGIDVLNVDEDGRWSINSASDEEEAKPKPKKRERKTNVQEITRKMSRFEL